MPSNSVLLVMLMAHQRKGFKACGAETVRGSLCSAPFRVSLHIAVLGMKGKKTYLVKKT